MPRRRSFCASVAVLCAGLLRGHMVRADVPPGVSPPVVVHHVDAVYPPSALAARKDADVVLTVTVDVDGHVSKVDVTTSGGQDLDEAAVVAAREWTFVPATRDGRPVASRIRMPFHFAPPAPPPEIVESGPKPGDVTVHTAAQSDRSTGAGESLPAPSSAERRPTETPDSSAPVAHASVIGRVRPSVHGPSDFRISLGELAVVPHSNAADVLKLAPSVFVTNEGGEGHADSLIVRGFDAGEGEAVEVSVGGVPVNDPGNYHGNGYADSHFILPETIESVRVLEGPFDPSQGNFAIAGSADYELGVAERGLTAKQTLGSYATERTLLTWGPENAGAHTFAAAEYAKSDGFGASRAYQRGSAVAQYEGSLGTGGLWRVTGQGYAVSAEAAGVVREDDVMAGRVGFHDTVDPNQGQDSARYSLSADIEMRSGPTTYAAQAYVVDRATRIREDFTGYVTDAGAPDLRGTGLDLAVSEQSIGSRGFARTPIPGLGDHQHVEIGYFARGDAVDNVQRLLARATQAPYATDAALSGTLGDLGLYGDASLEPIRPITLRGGLREELFTYVVEDKCPMATDCSETPTPSGNPRTSQATGTVLPRGSLLLGPFAGLTFAASAGQGVRSLAIDEVGSETSLPTITAYDGGVSIIRELGAGTITASSVFFGTRINRDDVFDPTVGRTVATGSTTRTGWTGAGRFTGRFLDVGVNASAVRGVVDSTREDILYVPHVMGRADAALFADLPWRFEGRALHGSLGLSGTFVGERSLPYAQTSPAYALADASVRMQWRGLQVALVGTNLLDTKVRSSEFTFVSDFHTQPQPTLAPARVFTAGAPRMLFVSLSATFGH